MSTATANNAAANPAAADLDSPHIPGTIPDSKALRACWHPVAFSTEVGTEKPYATTLLDQRIAIWRDQTGAPRAVIDMCIHRGTALSIGAVVNGNIACPYHGWQYDAGGRCRHIPQIEDQTKIPAKARVEAYHCQERYGIIWVAMDEPRWALPEVPELEAPDRNVLSAGPYTLNADASRAVENFTDFGHFPWVHGGFLGDQERPVVSKHTVEVAGHVLKYHYMRQEAVETEEFPVFGREKAKVAPMRHSYYELYLPYMLVVRQDWGGTDQMVHLYASQPVSANRSRGFLRTGRNYAHDQDPSVYINFTNMIMGQDKAVVETQRPEQVPFDLASELHLSFDQVAVQYRKAMRTHGLAIKQDVKD